MPLWLERRRVLVAAATAITAATTFAMLMTVVMIVAVAAAATVVTMVVIVIMAVSTVNVTMSQFFFGCFANSNNFNVEFQVLTRQHVVAVNHNVVVLLLS